jgi:hypothetical protein
MVSGIGSGGGDKHLNALLIKELSIKMGTISKLEDKVKRLELELDKMRNF